MSISTLCFLCLYGLVNAADYAYEQIGASINGVNVIDLSGDGTVIAVGGRIRVFENINGDWTLRGAEFAEEFSGSSLSLSSDGNILAIGSPGDNGNIGLTRIYQYNGTNWEQIGETLFGMANSEAASIGPRFGSSVSLSSDGKRLAIGAPRVEINGIFHSGEVRIYQYESGSWAQLGNAIEGPPGGIFGLPVALSSDGTVVAIGSHRLRDRGSCFIYQLTNGEWVQLGNEIEAEGKLDLNGWAVDISSNGMIVAVTAIWNDGNGANSGHARIFQFNTGTQVWDQLGQDIDGTAADDLFGASVGHCLQRKYCCHWDARK